MHPSSGGTRHAQHRSDRFAEPALRRSGRGLVDLADTTSALPDNLPDFGKLAATTTPGKLPFAATAQLAAYDRAHLFEDLKAASLSSRPGTLPKHSNLASVLLAIAVEKAYGQDFTTLLARFIEKPFGMQTGMGSSRSNTFVVGYTADHVAMPALDAPYIATAGGLRYSAEDMSRFLVAELAAKDPAIRLSQQLAWGDIDEEATAFNWKVDRTIDAKRRLRTSGGTMILREDRINRWGYSLLRSGKTEQAIGMFLYNTDHHAQSWNAWDSLGEAYEKANAKDKAIASYRRSVELNPTNAHAIAQLKVMAGTPD
jgi:CubicO group peptidase (beta-lactamase class C family)